MIVRKKQAEQNKRDMRLLNKWLEENEPIKISIKFGYTNTVTIYNWRKRGNLPHMRRNEIVKYLEKGISK